MRSQTQQNVRIFPVRGGLAHFNRLRGRAFGRGYIALGIRVAGDYFVATFLKCR